MLIVCPCSRKFVTIKSVYYYNSIGLSCVEEEEVFVSILNPSHFSLVFFDINYSCDRLVFLKLVARHFFVFFSVFGFDKAIFQ